jgi:hypothetical protein
MSKTLDLRNATINIIILAAIGILGVVASILLAVLSTETSMSYVAIILAMFSCTAFILVGIESIHKTIIRKS